METVKTVIHYGIRNEKFLSLIRSILIKGRIKQKYIDLLLDNEGIKAYSDAFTAPPPKQITSVEIDPNNYEVYEQIGDAVIANFIIPYTYRRFPQLKKAEGVKVVARIRGNYASEDFLSKLANKLGFTPYISYISIAKNSEQAEKEIKKKLEDVFEAFFGVTSNILDNKTQIGVGYAICYEILKNIYDNEVITLAYSDLWDPVSRLKEVFDIYKSLGKVSYVEEPEMRDDKYTVTVKVCGLHPTFGYRTEFGKAQASSLKSAKNTAAQQAINYLASLGIAKEVPKFYTRI